MHRAVVKIIRQGRNNEIRVIRVHYLTFYIADKASRPNFFTGKCMHAAPVSAIRHGTGRVNPTHNAAYVNKLVRRNLDKARIKNIGYGRRLGSTHNTSGKGKILFYIGKHHSRIGASADKVRRTLSKAERSAHNATHNIARHPTGITQVAQHASRCHGNTASTTVITGDYRRVLVFRTQDYTRILVIIVDDKPSGMASVHQAVADIHVYDGTAIPDGNTRDRQFKLVFKTAVRNRKAPHHRPLRYAVEHRTRHIEPINRMTLTVEIDVHAL